MRNLLLVTGGLVCAAGGLLVLPLPAPLGLPLLLMGTGLILAGSALARQRLKRLRTGNGRMHRLIAKGERSLPHFLRQPLRQTHPD